MASINNFCLVFSCSAALSGFYLHVYMDFEVVVFLPIYARKLRETLLWRKEANISTCTKQNFALVA